MLLRPKPDSTIPGDGDHLIEIRGVHDGWSVKVMTDGRLFNRWASLNMDDPLIKRRYDLTELWLEANWRTVKPFERKAFV